MMVPAMNFDHRRHRLSFTIWPLTGKVNGFGFGRNCGKGVQHTLFSRQFHPVIFAPGSSGAFDAGQVLG
jgi:hypothetical protein